MLFLDSASQNYSKFVRTSLTTTKRHVLYKQRKGMQINFFQSGPQAYKQTVSLVRIKALGKARTMQVFPQSQGWSSLTQSIGLEAVHRLPVFIVLPALSTQQFSPNLQGLASLQVGPETTKKQTEPLTRINGSPWLGQAATLYMPLENNPNNIMNQEFLCKRDSLKSQTQNRSITCSKCSIELGPGGDQR